jgi:hypothetical protein
MVAKQLKFLGHPPVNDIGSTLAVTLVTANVGGGGGGGSDTPETITCVVATVFPAALVAIRV